MEGSWKSEERTRPETSTPTNGPSHLTAEQKARVADASFNIKGLVFFLSQSGNTKINLS